MQNKYRWVIVHAAMLGLLSACGGGGDAAPAAPTQATPTETPASSSPGTGAPGSTPPTTSPSPQPPSPTQPVAVADCGLSNLAVQLLEKLNAERARGASCGSRGNFAATTAVTWNTRIESAALGHSNDMVAHNYFSHTSFDGRTLADRVNVTGYAWSRLGENIAAGYPSVDAVVAAWMASDGHCANMMSPAYREVGLACVRGTAANTYANYWTLNFGTPLN